MDSFGRLLRETREQKKLEIERVSEETSISKQYITALEDERVDVFPGDPYAIGFLRNYADYLELDPAYLVSLFRAKKIQEAPTPTALFVHRRPAYLIPLIIAGALIIAGGILALLWFLLRPGQAAIGRRTTISEVTGGASYLLSSEPLNKRLYPGDTLIVPHDGGDITLTVENTLSVMSLITPIGEQFVELGEEIELDVDGQPGTEIIVFVSDISRTNASRGAEVRVLLKNTDTGNSHTAEAAIDFYSLPARTTPILEDDRAYPFVINVSFRALCLLRYQTDRNDRIEDYYTNGDLLTIQANNATRLWISNDNAVKLQVVADGKNYDVDISRLGRVVVCDVRWSRDSANRYHLAVTELD
jgi:cytoskeletal protein RodZ